MSYHSHKLNSISHSHIIERTDPVTGDSVQENDSVVFCAVCKSCFLEDSWIYMNKRHCEQEQTLYAVPALASKLVVKKMKEEIIAVLPKRVDARLLGLLFTLISFLSLAFYYEDQATLVFLGSAFVGFTSSYLSSTNLYRKFVGFDKEDIRIFKNRIEIGKEIFYWKDIKQVKFQREMEYIKANPTSKLPTLFIYFHDETRQMKNLPARDYISINLFLQGLAKISNFTEVVFYTEHAQEYENSKQIKKNTKGNFTIKEPIQLLNDFDYPLHF